MITGPVNAVVTTGIYCRDGCPASPLPGNVRTYVVDAAAEAAGFRPCLRCRPEQRPEPQGWDATHVVAHALNEIAGGLLDVTSEHDLARRCGVSPRHLRRLFATEIGATPTQVAISRRAHFARRLLDETDLPIGQIAYAAGFGSVRSMNETIRRIFRLSPSACRSRRSRNDRMVADGGLQLTIPLRRPVQDTLFESVGAFVTEGVETVSGGAYTRSLMHAGYPGVVIVSMLRPDLAHVVAHLPRFDQLIEVADHIRSFLMQPKRPYPSWTPTEAAVKHHLVRSLGLRDARVLLKAATERFGTRLPGEILGLVAVAPDYGTLDQHDWQAVGLPESVAIMPGFDDTDPCDSRHPGPDCAGRHASTPD